MSDFADSRSGGLARPVPGAEGSRAGRGGAGSGRRAAAAADAWVPAESALEGGGLCFPGLSPLRRKILTGVWASKTLDFEV